MSNPQGPGRRPDDDADASEQTGELPVWGSPPPGGWGAADGMEHTGAWSPEQDPRDGWAGRGAADAGWDPATARQDAARDAGPGAPDTGGWSPQDTGGWNAQAGGRAAGGWGAQDAGTRDAQPGADPYGADPYGADPYGADPYGADPYGADPGRAAPPWGDAPAAWGDDRDPAAQGDQGDTWAVPAGRRGGRRRAPEEPTEAVPAGAPGSGWGDGQQAGAPDGGPGGWAPVEQGEEPWAPREAVRGPADPRKKWGLIGGGVLLVALVLLSALVWPAWALPARLDQTALQTGVNQVLTQDYGLTVGAVQCPDDVTVSAGTRFSCQAVVDGEQVEVPGVVTSDAGDYQVNRV